MFKKMTLVTGLLIPSLFAVQAYASCGQVYEDSIVELQPKVDEQNEITKKKGRVEFGFAAVGLSYGLVAVAGLPVEGAITGAIAGDAVGITAANMSYTDLENDPVGTTNDMKNAQQLLREAYVGGGEMVFSLLKQAIDKKDATYDKSKLSAASLSQLMMEMDSEDAFCASAPKLDTFARMRARVIGALK